MARADERFPLFQSGLMMAADGLRTAIANAPDAAVRSDLEHAEASVRRQIRNHRIPSPDEDRIWWAKDWR